MPVILKWLATFLRDFLNGYINPEWKAEQEALQRDAAAFQRQAAETARKNADIEKGVEGRDKEIDESQKKVKENEADIERLHVGTADKLKKVADAGSIEDVLNIK